VETLYSHKWWMKKLCGDVGLVEGETAKAMNEIMILMYGIPEHQKIVKEYEEAKMGGQWHKRRKEWTRSKVIAALIAFYRTNHRFPIFTENTILGYRCFQFFDGLQDARAAAMAKMYWGMKNEKKFKIPCGIELDGFFTKCYHTKSCAVSSRCPIAVPGAGHSQYCSLPFPMNRRNPIAPPRDFRRGNKHTKKSSLSRKKLIEKELAPTGSGD